MNIDPIHAEFGARISGVDLSQSLDDSTFAQIDEAINRHSLSLFENQQMNDEFHLDYVGFHVKEIEGMPDAEPLMAESAADGIFAIRDENNEVIPAGAICGIERFLTENR